VCSYQMSADSEAFREWSSGSRTYVAVPVIHAWPPSVGTTAVYFPDARLFQRDAGEDGAENTACPESW